MNNRGANIGSGTIDNSRRRTTTRKTTTTRNYQSSRSSSSSGGSRSSSNAGGNVMDNRGANIGSGTIDNSRKSRTTNTRKTTNNRKSIFGSGTRSPFSFFQDGSGFGPSNATSRPTGLIQPSLKDLAKSQKSPKKKAKMLKRATPPKPRNQGARFGPMSKKEMRGIRKKHNELGKLLRKVDKLEARTEKKVKKAEDRFNKRTSPKLPKRGRFPMR